MEIEPDLPVKRVNGRMWQLPLARPNRQRSVVIAAPSPRICGIERAIRRHLIPRKQLTAYLEVAARNFVTWENLRLRVQAGQPGDRPPGSW
jgi:hypothetical protein